MRVKSTVCMRNGQLMLLLMIGLLSESQETHMLTLNDRPIIGIVTQEVPNMLNRNLIYNSYIAASYVKYLEGAGAQVVPIWIGKTRLYYKKMVSSVNGILFPGGEASFENPKGYGGAAAYLYDYAVKMNKNGNYFPLWGTCLGFELLTYLSAGSKDLCCDCQANDQALNLKFKPGFKKSRLFAKTPNDIILDLMNKPLTAHFHHYCVTEKNMTKFGLKKEWKILSTNFDKNGLEFVSTIESRHYPFYGVQFHPEKNGYEWNISKHIPHNSEAITVMQYFANFFVNEARKNSNSFMDEQAVEDAVIYNYNATYTGKHLDFEQIYFFV